MFLTMKEFRRGVQRKKSIRQIRGERLGATMTNTAQCVVDTIEVVFQRIQVRAFAKSSPGTRTYLVCIHPTVATRKQPRYGEAEKVPPQSEEGSERRG
jgi:hypothetical protein